MYKRIGKYFLIALLIFSFFNITGILKSKIKFTPVRISSLPISADEFAKRKNKFIEFQHKLTKRLKKTNSLVSIKEFLKEDFYLLSDYYKILPDENKCHQGPDINTFSCHSKEVKLLKKIDKFVNVSDIIIVLQFGIVSIGSRTATITYCQQKKSPEKYPYIDYYYSVQLHKWLIESIRYERPVD